MTYFSDVERDLIVTGRTELADGVVAIDLASPNGRDLPAWTAGSHVDVILPAPDGAAGDPVERQYSLCSDPADRGTWRIAVLREGAGRGGSTRIHAEVHVGQRLRVRGPRNHFAFEPAPGRRVRFVAGGIGITAIRSMITAAEERGVDWQLDYAGRSRRTMAFLDELAAAFPDRMRVHAGDEGARLSTAEIAAEAGHDGLVYACGPARLLDALATAFAGRTDGTLHVERFESKVFGPPVWSEPFEVELAMSGDVVTVAPDQSILDAIRQQSPETIVLSSCRRGTCGTCEVPVLEGDIEHRDSVLTPVEQQHGDVMMICVSRAACPLIVLDL